jgi:hypothetical protein
MDVNNIDPHLAYLLPFAFLFGLVMAALVIYPLWRICGKAGFSPWLCLLIFIPFGALILLYVLAFARWRVVPAPMLGAGYPPYPQQPGYPVAVYPPAAPPAAPVDPYPRG